jgi:hypothetical protein
MSQIQFFQISPEQLQNQIIEGVKLQLEDLKKHFTPKEPNRYLSRQDVAEMLQIDLSSVHNWTKKGTLTSYQISGRVYYRLDEVENALVKLNK